MSKTQKNMKKLEKRVASNVSHGLGSVFHFIGHFFVRLFKFLDNKLTQAEKDQGLTMRTKAIELIRKNVDKANKEGVVIMIGHVWSADWLSQVLKDVYPELKAKGYVITTVSNCKGKK